MILFLDFDGVLHPTDARMGELFCHVPPLEAVLREYPAVEIVISSTWREAHPLDELRGFFSADIARRIVGQTPARPERSEVPPELWPFVREGECAVWMRRQQCESRSWLALDDDAVQFRPRSPILHLVDGQRGLTRADLTALRLRLRAGVARLP